MELVGQPKHRGLTKRAGVRRESCESERRQLQSSTGVKE